MNFVNITLLISVILATAFHRVGSKAYMLKTKNGAYAFNILNVTGPILIYLLCGGFEFGYPPSLYLYAVAFAILFLFAAIGTLEAIGEGSLALTSLVVAYSPLIPTFYGLIFLGEKATYTLFVGLVFLCISLVLINFEKKGEKKKITFKWIILVFLGFIGDGGKNMMLTIQQNVYKGQYSNEYLVISFLMILVVCIIMTLVKERENLKFNLKKGAFWSLICGLMTGIINLFVSILSNPARNMPASVMFPIKAAGCIIASLLVAVFVFKEKLSKAQILGLIMGVISIVFLSI